MDFERLKSSCYEISKELVKLSLEIESHPLDQCENDIITMLQSAAEQLVVEKRQYRDQLKEQCEALVSEILHKSQLISVEANFDTETSDVSGSLAKNVSSIVRPPYHQQLNKLMLKLECLNAQVSQRSQRENKLRLHARELSAKMELLEPTPPSSLSETDLQEFETRVGELQMKLKDREDRASSYLQTIDSLSRFIGERDHTDLEEVNIQNAKLSTDFLGKLKSLANKFESIYSERFSRVKDLETRIQSLAEALATPPDLPAPAGGIGSLERINLLESRLSELNQLKLQKIDLFIDNSRHRLRALWEKVYLDESQRQLFDDESPSETLLEKVEAEVGRLEMLLEDSERQPIFSCLAKYQQIRENEHKLAEMSGDPGRLARRGFAASLKQEEKLRRWNSRHKPEVIAMLNELIKQWACQHPNETFFMNGKSLPDLLVEENNSLSSSQRRQSLTRRRATVADMPKAREMRSKSGGALVSKLLSPPETSALRFKSSPDIRNQRIKPPNSTNERKSILSHIGPRKYISDASKQRAGAGIPRPRPLTALPPSRLNLPSSTPGRPSNDMRKPLGVTKNQRSRIKPVLKFSNHKSADAVQHPQWESAQLRKMQDMEVSYFDETSVQQPSFDYERDAF